MSCIGKSKLVKLKHMILCAGLMSLYFSLIFVVMIVNEWKITKRTSDNDIEDASLRNWNLYRYEEHFGSAMSRTDSLPVTEPHTPKTHLSTTEIKTSTLAKTAATTTTAVSFINSTSLFGGNATTPNATAFAQSLNTTANFTISVNTTAATNNTIEHTTQNTTATTSSMLPNSTLPSSTKEVVKTTKQATTIATTTTTKAATTTATATTTKALSTTNRPTTTQSTETMSTTALPEATIKATTTTKETTKETILETTITAPTSTTANPTSSSLGPKECKETIQGGEYRGLLSKTVTGVDCQRWDQQVPHYHSVSPQDFPNSGLESNYCRNADGEPSGPWCYTMNPDIRWEYCNVPFCT